MDKELQNARIVENAAATYRYHIIPSKDGAKALCGANVLYRSITEDPNGIKKFWGHKSHLNETYCSKCEEIYHGDKVSG